MLSHVWDEVWAWKLRPYSVPVCSSVLLIWMNENLLGGDGASAVISAFLLHQQLAYFAMILLEHYNNIVEHYIIEALCY